MNKIIQSEFKNLFLSKRPLIDVRAEIEFEEGSLPGAKNFPILNTAERTIIGTTYKKQGSQAAVDLGYQMISGHVKAQRVQAWLAFVKEHPDTVLYCFRGGQRSQISQKWLNDVGVQVPIIEGGYKKARQFLISEIENLSLKLEMLLISGVTGSAKTRLLRSLNSSVQRVDLEKLANHRGSAFGYLGLAPTQINFENTLAIELMKQDDQIEKRSNINLVLLEDESRLIGPSIIPDIFFKKMRLSEIILIKENLEFRVQEIFNSYVVDEVIQAGAAVFDRHLNSLDRIQKKLGGLRHQEIRQDILKSKQQYEESGYLNDNKKWIEKLLVYYYDPIYSSSLERRQVKIKFAGTFLECRQFIESLFK